MSLEEKKKELIERKLQLEKDRQKDLNLDRLITNDKKNYKACFGQWEVFQKGM